jgi:hypothetical protein
MRKLLIGLLSALVILSFCLVVEARQVAVGLNWFYEAAKMPSGFTVDQAYANTSKVYLYQSNDMGVTWAKIGEFPMSQFSLPAPTAGFPVKFNIDLADGAKYTIHFAMTEINLFGAESVKSNLLPVTIDLTGAAITIPPTIKTITITIVVP